MRLRTRTHWKHVSSPHICLRQLKSLWTDDLVVSFLSTASSVSSNSTARGPSSLKHPASRESLKSIDMSFINHFRRTKHDKSGSSSRSASVEPRPNTIPRIVTTTDAPSIVSRDILKKPQMSRTTTQDRNVSASSAASGSTIAAEDSHQNQTSILDRAKSAIMTRAASPSPPTSRDSVNRRSIAPRGNHVVTDAVFTFRPKLEGELKGSKQAELVEGVSSESLLIFISNDRLKRMPARGSRWDKILKWAEDFAKKLALFEVTDESFIPSSKEAVELICASIQLLLLVGPPTSFPRMPSNHGPQRPCQVPADMHEQLILTNEPCLTIARTPEWRGSGTCLWDLPRVQPHV